MADPNTPRRQRKKNEKQPVQEWIDDFDSPIEQAKMHPRLHASLKILVGIDIIIKILLLCYANHWIDIDGGMFDSLVFSGGFLLDVVMIIALLTVRVAKESLR